MTWQQAEEGRRRLDQVGVSCKVLSSAVCGWFLTFEDLDGERISATRFVEVEYAVSVFGRVAQARAEAGNG